MALHVPVCQDTGEGIITLKRKIITITALPESKSVVDTYDVKAAQGERKEFFTSYGHDNHSGYFGVLFYNNNKETTKLLF